MYFKKTFANPWHIPPKRQKYDVMKQAKTNKRGVKPANSFGWPPAALGFGAEAFFCFFSEASEGSDCPRHTEV